MSNSPKEKIEACVEKFIAAGGHIIAEDWNVTLDVEKNKYLPGENENPDDETITYPACCPLGAVLVAQDPRQWTNDNQNDAAYVLGVTPNWVSSFVVGVDDGDVDQLAENNYVDEAYQLGREFRDKYVRDE